MNIEVTDPIGALVVLAIVLIVAWLVAYSAARAATDDLRTVVLSVTAKDGSTVSLEIANHGMKTAYAVTVHPVGVDVGEALARAGDIRPGATATVRIERSALIGESEGPLPTAIRLAWRIGGPQGSLKWNPYALVHPSGGAGA